MRVFGAGAEFARAFQSSNRGFATLAQLGTLAVTLTRTVFLALTLVGALAGFSILADPLEKLLLFAFALLVVLNHRRLLHIAASS